MNNIAFIVKNKFITIESFYSDIAQLRQNIKHFPYENILLFDLDTYRFTVQLFALLLENRHVLLPPNAQTGTVQQLSSLCDAVMGSIVSEDKPKISYGLSENNNQNTDEYHVEKDNILFQPNREALFTELKGQITFFTSGSTGQPKPIVKYVSQLISEIEILSTTFSVQLLQSSCVVSTVSHQHIYGLLFKVLVPLRLGITIVNKTFEYPEHINTFFDDLLTYGDDLIKTPYKGVLISSPAHLKRLVLDNVLVPIKNTISATFSSGGPLSFATSQCFDKQMQQAPIEVFGSTETGGIAWRCGQIDQKSPWQLFPTLSYKSVGEVGQLAINSPYVIENEYLTDDLIQPINANSFYLLGRVDRTIKLEEKRINLAHVESCLLAHPWVSEIRIFVLPLSVKNTREVLAAVVELTQLAFDELEQQGKAAINKILKQQLLTEFERISLPKKWRYVRALPYNAQGKTALNELERLFD
jgi:acyl-coenzyme A synthetase/AMP-(fatty) acid ligase